MSDTRFINSYPYTDFHEMNLDWIITQVESLTTKVDNIMSDKVVEEIEKYFNTLMPKTVYNESTTTITLSIEVKS